MKGRLVPPNDLSRTLLGILEGQARGHDNAIRIPKLAMLLDCKPRDVQELGATLIDKGHLIGSGCGKSAGLYLIESREDLEHAVRHVRRRAVTSLIRLRKLRKAAERKFSDLTLFDIHQEAS